MTELNSDERASGTRSPADSEHELTREEILYWLEFACWTMLALAPFLYWVNGPAVSTDQLVVRTALVVLASCGALGLRIGKLFHRRRAQSTPRPERTDDS